MNTDHELWNKLYDDDEFEYVRFIAFHYYPDYLEEPMCIPADLPPLDEVPVATEEETKLTCIGIREDGFAIFRDIQTGKKEFIFKEDDYYGNEDIQQALELIGLEPKKFWHALLYIHYMAERDNTDCVPVSPSVHEQIKELYLALNEEGTTVTIKRRGKAPFVIKDPDVKKFIVEFLQAGDKKYVPLRNPSYTGGLVHHTADKEDVGLCWQIYDEYCAFKLLFDRFCTDKDRPPRVAGQRGSRNKDLLVSRIIYMTRLVEDERYLDSPNPLHAIKKRCSETPRPRMDSGLFN